MREADKDGKRSDENGEKVKVIIFSISPELCLLKEASEVRLGQEHTFCWLLKDNRKRKKNEKRRKEKLKGNDSYFSKKKKRIRSVEKRKIDKYVD